MATLADVPVHLPLAATEAAAEAVMEEAYAHDRGADDKQAFIGASSSGPLSEEAGEGARQPASGVHQADTAATGKRCPLDVPPPPRVQMGSRLCVWRPAPTRCLRYPPSAAVRPPCAHPIRKALQLCRLARTQSACMCVCVRVRALVSCDVLLARSRLEGEAALLPPPSFVAARADG